MFHQFASLESGCFSVLQPLFPTWILSELCRWFCCFILGVWLLDQRNRHFDSMRWKVENTRNSRCSFGFILSDRLLCKQQVSEWRQWKSTFFTRPLDSVSLDVYSEIFLNGHKHFLSNRSTSTVAIIEQMRFCVCCASAIGWTVMLKASIMVFLS